MTQLAHQSPMIGTLDMTDERDRGLLRRKVDDGPNRRRWPEITDEFKADAVRALKVALRMSLEAKDHRGINGCVKTLALLEGQNQKDDHVAVGVGRSEVNVNVQQNQVIVVEHDRGG